MEIEAGEEVACRLHSSEFAERLRDIERTLMRDVVAVTEVGDGFAFTLKDAEGMIGRIAEFIATERECCPFFRFGLEVSGPGTELTLRISGSVAAKEFARESFLPLVSIA